MAATKMEMLNICISEALIHSVDITRFDSKPRDIHGYNFDNITTYLTYIQQSKISHVQTLELWRITIKAWTQNL